MTKLVPSTNTHYMFVIIIGGYPALITVLKNRKMCNEFGKGVWNFVKYTITVLP